MENNYELNYLDLLKIDELNILSDIYTNDIEQYYFDEDTDIIISPYLNVADLNKSATSHECIKPKSAIEIGIKINF